MKHLRGLGLAALALTLMTGIATAQKKSVKKAPVKKTTPVVAILPPLDVRAARQKVDNQLSNVDDYLNTLSLLAPNLETAIADKNANKLRPATVQKVDLAQQRVIKSIQDLRAGLAALESEFRTKAALQKYLPSLEGIADLAAQAEDSASLGKFVASKDPLREISKKLTDTLALMPRSAAL